MKTIEEFLSYLCSLDVKLWVEENRLRCSAPKDVLTPVIKEELAERKEDVLAFIRNNSVALVADKQPIRPVKRQENLPLSFAQQRLWFTEQLTQVSQVFDVPAISYLKGSLNVAFLENVINEIVCRHEILRTSFISVEGQPVQIIHSNLKLSLPVVDLQGLAEAERKVEIQRLINNVEASLYFNLTEVPLLWCILIKLSQEEHISLLLMHHIITDGWSVGVITNELTTLYKAFSQNQPSPLPELPIQYADFAVWQRQYLQGKVLDNLLTYWKQKLSGNLPTLQLPTDYSRPAIQTVSGKRKSFFISANLTQALKTLSRNEDATIFMTLLASFKILLHRYSGQDDILVGSPIANRNQHDIEQLIGFFVNTLVFRTNFSGNPSFQELLRRVRETTLGVYAHQDMPFELLVDKLQPQRNLSYTPLFQVVFVLHNAPISEVEMPGLTFSSVEADNNRNVMFDLILHITETESGLDGGLDYNTDLFQEDTICQMVSHLQTLLEAIVANPKQRLSELPLLTEPEKHQLLVEWNNTEAEYSQQQCIHELFEAQVEETPNAIAVVFENQQLSYRELNQRANQLAHYLRSLGVKPEVLVGICVERSLSMVIGLLAILKGGGAYVPLDPSYPQERLAFMLEDASVSVVLTQQHLIENLPQNQTRVVCLDTNWESVAQQSSQNPINESTTDNLAYIIYTSGSTGQPKGVLVNHANVVRLLAATESWYNFNQHDVWTLFHSIAFDFSVWEIWGALLYGGQLVVVPYWLSRSPEDFYKLLQTQQVTVLNQTPSAFRQLIQVEESLGNSNNLSLRKVIFGGEALQLESLRPWFERHGDQSPQLINMYGITETTVHVTYRPLTMADLEVASASLIGRPIGDLQVYLLDMYGQPVPIGVPGEMYIGGAGVVRGYLNRPELTPQRFIPNRFSDKPNARLYKSGDKARYLPNGDIEYLGRIDHQVKVRGFRIELGEIEAVITQHPIIRETVVVVHEESADSQRIVAYIVPQKEQTLILSELRSFLESKLPSYMIPAAFVTLEVLPLTPNGKIDRTALPAPDTARPQLEEAFVAPRTKEEKILAEAWAKVLGIKQVGIHDNFFSLGGDSIRSIQVQSEVQKHGLNFSIQQLFRFQTIYELAKILVNAKESNINVKAVKPFSLLSEADRQKLPDDLEDAYPLSKLQVGMLFHSISSPDTAIYHNVTSLHLKAPFDLQKLLIAIQELAASHPVLRTSFDLENYSEPIQFVHKIVSIPLQVEDLRHLGGNEQEKVLAAWYEAEKTQKFDWTCPPVLRFQVHLRSEETFQFSFSEHHAILDGWSVASMVTELFGRYLFLLGQNISFLESSPTTAYRDFIALERETLVSDECQNYWSEKLKDSTVTTIPRWSKIDQVANHIDNIGVHQVELSPEVSLGLKQLAQLACVPLKSILLAAHFRVLSLLSGQTDVITGLVSNGRPEKADGERTLGLFLNTIPFRLKLSGGTWLDLVQKTFDAEQEFLSYRRYPLAEIQRRSEQQSLFETAFNFTNFHVYQGVLGLDNVQVLSSKLFAETNFAFCTQFSLDEFSSKIHLDLEYDVKEFSSKQIEAIGGYYARTLTAIAAEHKKRYKSISLLSPEEQHQLLVEWNNTSVEYPQQLCIHDLFEAQVEKTPDAVAVVFEDEQLTYSELNARANQLAHYLQKLGVKPEVLVGICVERSLSMVIGLLAILKAGGAYVPLDPSYPIERIAFILEDTQAPVLLTQASLVEAIPQHQAAVVCLDTDWYLLAQQSQENLFSELTTDNLAYVIYTSGSTGKPKGVMIKHASTVAMLDWANKTFTPEARAGVLASTSICFDLSVFEVFVPLCSGGKVILIENALYLATLPAAFGVTLINTVPSVISQLIRNNSIPRTVQAVNIAGEPLQNQLVQQLYQQNNIQQVFNLYGPSEDTTYSTSCWIHPGASNTPPIGRPIHNTQTYLLDQNLQPVPVGVPGMLYMGGAGLARGYFNQPELTADKFIPNPYANLPGERLYKTGDLARYLPNGEIEYIGRIDNQVKIRGFRIELGEIETQISQHPAIQEAVVAVYCSEADSQRIVAYIVSQTDQTLTISELRSFLQSNLPNYMVPAAFIILEALPLTPNGKVDRKALPAPDTARPQLEAIYQQPQTEVEKTIAGIWQEILNVEKVGIHDNFFDLGGHSLLLVQIHSKLQKTFQRDFLLVEMFQYPTISHLAKYFSQESKEEIAFIKHSQVSESRAASLQRRKQARKEHRTATKEGGISSQSSEQNLSN
ncbi:non-ribosomal peptide synthetase [Nostoc sp. ChiQUE01b]|uniref:non-ribosomal peptide synthetase n=1 Tax=Nostoc sp. ChiQUE01b TaxID=3075376 RepID=UPI002AD30210|nr:non-ribosomal peptide synthetase [Nostoc sp. ChiQUE01b]MDZ8261482.1 amino acid adenylation domain-containing protein [Nostoc sp. ChiQUE01b]